MLKGDQEEAMKEKDFLEVEQRQAKAKRDEKGEQFIPKYFEPSKEDPKHYVYKWQKYRTTPHFPLSSPAPHSTVSLLLSTQRSDTLLDPEKEVEDVEYDYRIYTVLKQGAPADKLLLQPSVDEAWAARNDKRRHFETNETGEAKDEEFVDSDSEEMFTKAPEPLVIKDTE